MLDLVPNQKGIMVVLGTCGNELKNYKIYKNSELLWNLDWRFIWLILFLNNRNEFLAWHMDDFELLNLEIFADLQCQLTLIEQIIPFL